MRVCDQLGNSYSSHGETQVGPPKGSIPIPNHSPLNLISTQLDPIPSLAPTIRMKFDKFVSPLSLIAHPSKP